MRKKYINESSSYDQVYADYESIASFLNSNGFTRYDLIDYEMFPRETSKIVFEIEGDWKHDHMLFTDLLNEWAEKNNRNIIKIDSEEVDDDESDSDWYRADYSVYIAKDDESYDFIKSIAPLFEEADESEKQFHLTSYYDNQLKGVEDSIQLDWGDEPDFEDWIWEKCMQGNCVEVVDTANGERHYFMLPYGYNDYDEILDIDDLEVDYEYLKNHTNESLTEASYGGAYDIEDDQYFTREDLDNFGYVVQDALEDAGYNGVQYNGCWIDNGILTLNMMFDDTESEWETKIDFRKIKTPDSLVDVYAPKAASYFDDEFDVAWHDQYNESLEPLRESVYVAELPEKIQDKIKSKLVKKGLSGEDIELAMNSKVNDLSDTIDISSLSEGFSYSIEKNKIDNIVNNIRKKIKKSGNYENAGQNEYRKYMNSISKYETDHYYDVSRLSDYFQNKLDNINESVVIKESFDTDTFENIIQSNGFDIDGKGKTLFGNTHYQIIKNDVTYDADDFDSIESIVDPLVSDFEEYEKEQHVSITWNFGLDETGHITAGVDIRELNISEMLNNIDHKMLDEGKQFQDLRSLYEAVNDQLTPQERSELKNIISTTGDPDAITSYVNAKLNKDKKEDSNSNENNQRRI